MKKILLIITAVISLLICTPSVFATNYFDSVNVKTSFAEDVDMESIERIEIHLEDATEYSKDYLLEKDNDFELSIDDVPVGPYKFVYGVVIGDEIGYYSVSATVNINNQTNTVDVLVIIDKGKTNSNKSVELTEKEVEKIKGTSSKVTQNNDDNENEIIIGDDDDNDEESEDEENSSKIPKAVEAARQKEQEEERKQKERKRNSLIGKIMFSIIGIVFVCLIIYAAIKISNANK